MAAPAFRSISTATASAANLTLSKPSGAVEGDLLVAFIASTAPPTGTPTGWTRLTVVSGSQRWSALFYKRMTKQDESASGWTWTSTADDTAGWLAAISGASMVKPIDVENAQNNAASSTSVTAPSVTTTVADALIVCGFMSTSGGTWTPPSGMTERADVQNGTALTIEYADVVQASAGATGTKVATLSAADTDTHGHILAIVPAVTPASGTYVRSIETDSQTGSPPQSHVVDRPALATQGDILVAQMFSEDNTDTWSLPSGWTLIRNDSFSTSSRSSKIAYKALGASEPATYTFTKNSGDSDGGVAIIALVRVKNVSPIDNSTGKDNTTAGTAVPADGFTTAHNNEQLLWFALADSDAVTMSPPSGMTELYDYAVGGSGGMAGSAAEVIQAAAGATGTKQGTASGSVESIGQLVGLVPHTAPVAPSLVAPASGLVLDAAAGFVVDWTFDGSNYGGSVQAGWAMRRKIGAGAYEYWNATSRTWQGTEVVNTGSADQETFEAGKWTNGNTYDWSIAVKDNVGANLGPYAADRSLVANTPPSGTVTAPTDPAGDARPLVAWTYSDPETNPQTSYRVKIFSQAQYTAPGFDPSSSSPTWDSTEVASAATQTQVGTDLVNGTTYRAYVQLKDSVGTYSAWSFATFTVAFNAPAVPTITATADDANARVVVVAQARDNLLSVNEASIETDATGWANDSNATLARGTTQALQGAASLEMTATAGADMRAKLATREPVTVGLTYTALASFRKVTAGSRSVRVLMRWFDSGGSLLSTVTGSSVSASDGAWTQAEASGVAPASAATVEVVLEVLAPSASEVWRVDAISVAPGTSTVWTRGGLVGTQSHKMIVEKSDDAGATWTALRGSPFSLNASLQVTTYDYESPLHQTRLYRAKTTAEV